MASAPMAAAAAVAAQAEPDASRDKMVGERNESSVLFSLSDLTGDKKKADDDLPRTEGSGLIDIRVLAQAQSSVGPGDGDASDPLGGGTSPSGSGPRLAVNPVIPLPTRRSNTGLYVGIGIGVAVIVGLLVAIILVLMRKEPTPTPAPGVAENDTPAAEQAAAPAEAPPAEATPEPEPEQVAAVDTPDAGDAADAAGDATDDAVAEADGQAPEPATEQVAAATPPPTQEQPRAEERQPEERSPEPTREERTPEPTAERGDEPQRGEDAVNDALNLIAGRQGQNSGTTAPAEREPEPEEEQASALPETLSRNEVQSTIRRYGSRISGCRDADTPEGSSYRVTFTIQPSGGVSGVSAEDGSGVGQCLAGVVSGMTFPRFSGAPIPVTFPFRL